MRKTLDETAAAIRAFVDEHPEIPYSQVAVSFGISEPTVKRLCAGGGRGKAWRRGRTQSETRSPSFGTKSTAQSLDVGHGRAG